MIKVYKDWVIAADDKQYKIGTLKDTTDKDTGETKIVMMSEYYASTLAHAVKIISDIEKRRTVQDKDMTLSEAIETLKKINKNFERILQDVSGC